MKVSAILNVTDSLEPSFPDKFRYKIIQVTDDETSNIYQHFRDCIAFISEVIANKETILVHCAAGVSRSASVVIAYIMYSQRIKLADAFNQVKDRRPCIKPNPGFIRQLQEFEKELISEGIIN